MDVFREGETIKIKSSIYTGSKGGEVFAFLEKNGVKIFESLPLKIEEEYINLSCDYSFKISWIWDEDFNSGKYI